MINSAQLRDFTRIKQTHTWLQDDLSHPTSSPGKPFPFVCKPAFSLSHQVLLAFCQHLFLMANMLMKGFKHGPSLTNDQSALANSSKGHRNFVTLKAAQSSQRKNRPGQRRGPEAREGRGKEIFIALCTIRQRKTKRTSVCRVPREGLLKHEMLKTILKHYGNNLPACSRAGICSLIWAGKSFAMRFLF